MRLKRYTITINTSDTGRSWVRITGIDDDHPNGTGWELVKKFDLHCIMEKWQAEAWLNKPAIDPRYQLREVNIGVKKPN